MSQIVKILSILLICLALTESLLPKSSTIKKAWTKAEVKDLINDSENHGKNPNIGHSKTNHLYTDARNRHGSGAGATHPSTSSTFQTLQDMIDSLELALNSLDGQAALREISTK